jgi:hypothetical protein
MFSPMNLLVGVITGAFGMAYFIYGKKQGRMIFMATGIALMAYPYLFGNLIVLIVIGVLLLPLPFVLKE